MLLVLAELSTFGYVALAVVGWGGVRPFFAHPARATAAGALCTLAIVSAFSGIDVSTGRREGAESRRIILPYVVLTVVSAWLPAASDRRDLWTIDGDTMRWLGVALLLLGGTLRVWPMFALGRRFSPFVAIQEGHELCTDGPYRWVRNPSYLGGLVVMVGWGLVFRSALGVALVVPGLWLVVGRIRAEEALLASEFGERWAAYRAHTWRLVPFVY